MATVTITGSTTRDSTARQDNRPWYVEAVGYQDGGDGGVITPRKSRAFYPVAGVLTMELEAGIVAYVTNPDGDQYLVTVPDEDSALWDLIAADVLIPPGTSQEALDAALAAYLTSSASSVGEAILLATTEAVARQAIGTIGVPTDYLTDNSGDYMVNDVVRYTDPAPTPTADASGLYVCITDHTVGSPKDYPARWERVVAQPEPAKLAVNGYNPLNAANPLANAIGDGSDHPLSERFATLADAQAVFPFVTSLTEQIDESAFVLGMSLSDVVIAPPGIFRIKLGFLWQANKTLIGPAIFKPAADATATAMFRANDIDGWRVEGVTFDANSQMATGVRIWGASADFVMQDVDVTGATDVGMNLVDPVRGLFRRVRSTANGSGDTTDANWWVTGLDNTFIDCDGNDGNGNGWRFLGTSSTAARNRFTGCRANANTRHGFYGVGTRSDAPVDYVFTDCVGNDNGSAGQFSGMALHLLNRVRGKGLWASGNTEHGLVLQDQYGAVIEVAGSANGRELVRMQADFSVTQDSLSGARYCYVDAVAEGNGVGAFTQRGPISIEGSCHDIRIKLIAIGNAGVPVKIPTHAGYNDPYNIEISGGVFSGNAGGNNPVNDGAGSWWGTNLVAGTRTELTGANRMTTHLPKIDTIRDATNDKAVLDLSTNNSASAVNYLYIANAATGSPARIGAGGSDTDVDINVTPKGTGRLTEGGVRVRRTIQNVTSTTTLASTGDRVIFIGASGVVTLPTAVSNTCEYTLKNVDTTSKTISTTSSQTIEGLTTYTLPPGASIDVISDGSNWRIV